MNINDFILAGKLAGSGGGGGGGGANTANITFRNSSSATIDVIGAFNTIGGASEGITRLFPNEPYAQSVFMSQNGADLYINSTQIPQNYSVTVSGDITDDGDGYYVVTGDGEIEIKSGK